MADSLFASANRPASRCAFDEMGLRVGDRLEFQQLPGKLHPRLFTHLIGYEPGLSLLVRTPYEGHLPVNVQEGDAVVIRTFSGTKAFAFTSRIQRLCIAPFLYLHLDFPEAIQCLEIRADERLPLRLLAEARPAGGEWQPALLLDLGMGGALVESNHPLGQPGQVLELRFAFPVPPLEGEVSLCVEAVLQHVDAHHGSDGLSAWRHGVAFRGLGKGDSVMLRNFLFRLLLEPHGG